MEIKQRSNINYKTGVLFTEREVLHTGEPPVSGVESAAGGALQHIIMLRSKL